MNAVPALERDPMAKKKSVKVRNPEGWERKPMVLTMRGSAEFKAALEEAAAYHGVTVTTFADEAIRAYAKQVGYPKQLPRR